MSSLRNRVQLIGHTGNAPQITNLESGKKVAKISLATSEKYKASNGESKTDTQWHNLIAWGKTADIFEKYIEKGNLIAVEGKLVNRSYDDKDGIKRYVTEIIVNEVQMLGSKSDTNESNDSATK